MLFRKIEKATVKRGIRIGVYGSWGVGKTHFICTFPDPIYIVDTEFGSEPVTTKFADKKEIYTMDAVYAENGIIDPIKSLKLVEDALRELKDVEYGTIAIDSVTNIWKWLGIWLDDVATRRYKKTGEVMRTEWGKANDRYIKMILSLLHKRNVHVVLTSHETNLYDSQGNPLPIFVPRWQSSTPHWVDFLVRIYWKEVQIGTVKKKQRMFSIEKCRFGELKTLEYTEFSYDTLMGVLERELGIRIVCEKPGEVSERGEESSRGTGKSTQFGMAPITSGSAK